MNPKKTLARFGKKVGTGLAAARPHNLLARHKLQDVIDSDCQPNTPFVARAPCWKLRVEYFIARPVHLTRLIHGLALLFRDGWALDAQREALDKVVDC